MPFQALGLHPLILQAIQETGYTEPTPIQGAAIPEILKGNDLIGIAQTGTGKTAAFTLPLLHRLHSVAPARQNATRTLILAPTRELVVQIEENVQAYAKHLPISITKVFGGVSERPQIQALRSGAQMVIATESEPAFGIDIRWMKSNERAAAKVSHSGNGDATDLRNR